MSATEFNVNLRDLQFVLFEQLGIAKLCDYELYKDFSEDDFRMIVDEAARFAREVTAPANRPSDAEGCTFKAGDVTTPSALREAWHAFREAGWICMNGHVENGGQGLPTTVSTAAGELFTGSCCSLALCSLLTAGVIHVLENFAPADMKETYLPKLFAGDWTGTMVLTESSAGSDVGAGKTKARKAPNGDHYLISGEKIFITYGDHDLSENIVHLVLARVEGAVAGTKGLSIFVVPKYRLNPDGTPGDFNDVRCTGIEHKMGIHGSATCTMSFGDDEDCHGYILGNEGDGIRIMFHMMNEARIDCGVQGSAQASAAYLNALAYAQERIQGTSVAAGRDPNAPKVTIDNHPDVRRMLMGMKAYAEGMRSLLFSTANLIDIAHNSPDEAERARANAFVGLLTPICKAHCSDMGFDVCNTAIQVYGGFGYTREYPAEQYTRDVRIAAIYEGANGIQAMDLFGRKIPMKGGEIFGAYMTEMRTFAKGLFDDAKLGSAAKALDQAAEVVMGLAMHLGGLVRKDVEEGFLWATPLLRAMGDCVIGYHLLQQAAIAAPKLAAAAGDNPSRETLENSPEARFYAGKLANAAWFATNVLPRIAADADVIKSGDRTPLDIVF